MSLLWILIKISAEIPRYTCRLDSWELTSWGQNMIALSVFELMAELLLFSHMSTGSHLHLFQAENTFDYFPYWRSAMGAEISLWTLGCQFSLEGEGGVKFHLRSWRKRPWMFVYPLPVRTFSVRMDSWESHEMWDRRTLESRVQSSRKGGGDGGEGMHRVRVVVLVTHLDQAREGGRER